MLRRQKTMLTTAQKIIADYKQALEISKKRGEDAAISFFQKKYSTKYNLNLGHGLIELDNKGLLNEGNVTLLFSCVQKDNYSFTNFIEQIELSNEHDLNKVSDDGELVAFIASTMGILKSQASYICSDYRDVIIKACEIIFPYVNNIDFYTQRLARSTRMGNWHITSSYACSADAYIAWSIRLLIEEKSRWGEKLGLHKNISNGDEVARDIFCLALSEKLDKVVSSQTNNERPRLDSITFDEYKNAYMKNRPKSGNKTDDMLVNSESSSVIVESEKLAKKSNDDIINISFDNHKLDNDMMNGESETESFSNPISKESMQSIYQKINTENQLSSACFSLNSALSNIVTEEKFSELRIQTRELSALRLFSANSESLEKQLNCINLLIQQLTKLPNSLEMSELKSTTINLLANMQSRVMEVIKQINNFNSDSTSKDVERLGALLKQRPSIMESAEPIKAIISHTGVLKLANYLNKSLFIKEGNVNVQNSCKRLANKLLDALIGGDRPQLTDVETSLLKQSNILTQIYSKDVLPNLDNIVNNEAGSDYMNNLSFS